MRALSGLAKGVQFHKVNLKGKFDESIITNSSKLASLIEESKCQNADDVDREMEREIKGKNWEKDK